MTAPVEQTKPEGEKPAEKPKPQEPAKQDEKPADGPHGYPEGSPVAEMNPAQQLAYFKHKARREEDARKAAQQERDALKPQADQYQQLLDSTKSEQEKAVEAARKEADTAARAEASVALAGQRLHGLLMVRGKSEEDADAIVGDLNLAKYVKDGRPDVDELRKAADRLAPKVESAKPAPVDLGQGRREATGKTGVAAGEDLYAQRHPKNRTT